MKTFILFVLCAIGLALAQSCVAPMGATQNKPVILTPVTKKVIKDYSLSYNDLKKIQYFNGPDNQSIILKKISKSQNDTIVSGKVIIRYIENRDSVWFKPFTKGAMLLFYQNEVMDISFEADSLYLRFGPDQNGTYVLYGPEGKNEVWYGSNRYQITSGGNGSAKLYFDLERFLTTYRKGRIVPGRVVQ